jgi:hypothetical protein
MSDADWAVGHEPDCPFPDCPFCPACDGRGYVNHRPCGSCHGTGHVQPLPEEEVGHV